MPKRHEVRQGENIVSLGDLYGFFPATIWDHPDNSALKEERGDMSILMPGDVVVIPDKREKQVSKPDKQKHRFRRKGVPAVFRMQIFDVEEPRRNQAYSLTVDGKKTTGQTDGDGMLEALVSPKARSGRLIIGPDNVVYDLDFGHLDPVTEVSGVQKRLNNLGFDCGDPGGTLNPRTEAALRAFQTRYDLKVTGQIDQATRDKLVELHDDVHDIPPAESQA